MDVLLGVPEGRHNVAQCGSGGEIGRVRAETPTGVTRECGLYLLVLTQEGQPAITDPSHTKIADFQRAGPLDVSMTCRQYAALIAVGEDSCILSRISSRGIAEESVSMSEGKGLLIVYTGPGKGKTTCALGTAFRAVGQGLRVLMVQFIKGSWHYGELDAAKMLGDDKMEILPMGRGFVKVGGAETDPEDVRLCEEAWSFALAQIQSEKYDLVVLDEINYVISYRMLDPEKVVTALASRPERVHVICTGRNAHPLLVEAADLVTEMREVKHPYTKGILAQRGIDY